MLNFYGLCIILILTTACSSTTAKVNQGSSEVSSGVSAIENAASTVDRAIATEKRLRDQYEKK